MQADGKILAGGAFTTLIPNGGAAGDEQPLGRLEKDGRVDRSLNQGIVGGYFTATAVQPDGKIIVGGNLAVFSVWCAATSPD